MTASREIVAGRDAGAAAGGTGSDESATLSGDAAAQPLQIDAAARTKVQAFPFLSALFMLITTSPMSLASIA
jgi:hypothetical protein